MGNILPFKMVLDDIDEQNEESGTSEVNQRSSRVEQLATIRNLNQNTKHDEVRTQLKPAEGTILEEAVLEDLCGEADIELDKAEHGPMSNHQKAELITRLSANPNTRKHFETTDSFDLYVAKTVNGDRVTKHNLSIDYGRALQTRTSQSIQRLDAARSKSLCPSQLSISRTSNISRNDLCDQLQAHRSNISTRSRKSNQLIANLIPSENQTTGTLKSVSDDPLRWSKMTTYSLPSNFVNNNYSAMDEVDRRKTSVVCQTNENTLKMANELVAKGKIKPGKEPHSVSSEEGFECLCIGCY